MRKMIVNTNYPDSYSNWIPYFFAVFFFIFFGGMIFIVALTIVSG